MVALLLFAGLRHSEAAAITLGDLDLDQAQLLVRGKGAKQRTVALAPPAVQALRDCLNCRPATSSDHLFVSRVGGMLTVAIRGPVADKMREMAEQYGMSLARLLQDAALVCEGEVAGGYHHTRKPRTGECTMYRVWRRWLDDRLMAGIGLAVLLFACWQVLNHYVVMDLFMAQLGLSMVYYHYISFVVEMCFAILVAAFASKALAAKNQQLEELHRQKDLFANALVHDLRQPLTAVIGGLSSVAFDSGVPADTQELVEIARSGADELLGMVNNLLDLSRLGGGRRLFEPQPVDLPRAIRSGVDRVAELARERDQHLTVDLAADLPEVYGDAERLSRVVTNLVGNAIKYTPTGGDIRVRAVRDGSRNGVLVTVSDTGPGIPKESREVIFDKFATLQASTPGARTSTGLGLTFCKAIVEAHGGRIWVDCPPGQGSTFAFSLPAAPEADRRRGREIAA